jgi:protein-tyrosine phosphatase
VRALGASDSAREQGLGVYLHCWGGIGRTGTVVGCWLVRHGASGSAALDRIAELHGATPDGARRSPETEAQREAVLGWSPAR